MAQDIRQWGLDSTFTLQVNTPGGTQFTPAELMFVLSVAPAVNDTAPVTLGMFSLLGDGLTVSGHDTGRLSFWIDQHDPGVYDSLSGTFHIPVTLTASYALIDSMYPPIEEEEDEAHGDFETYQGTISGTLDQAGNANATFTMNLAATPSKTGAINSISISGSGRITDMTPPAKNCVDPELKTISKTICIQPIFVQNNAGTRTGGSSWPAASKAVADVWKQCCLTLSFQDPCTLKVAAGMSVDKMSQADANAVLAGATCGAANCIPIFVVRDFNGRLFGGGKVNAVGRGAGGRIIYCDSAITGGGTNTWVANATLLGHELGHLLGLCHPGDPACPSPVPAKGGGRGYNEGTTGSVMTPSGGLGANPTKVRWADCDNADNALVKPSIFACCKTLADVTGVIPRVVKNTGYVPGERFTTDPVTLATSFGGTPPYQVVIAPPNTDMMGRLPNSALPGTLTLNVAGGKASITGTLPFQLPFAVLGVVYDKDNNVVGKIWWVFDPGIILAKLTAVNCPAGHIRPVGYPSYENFSVCNTGALPDSFVTYVSDTRGWIQGGSASFMEVLGPGECSPTLTVTIVPNNCGPYDGDVLSFSSYPLGNIASGDTCVTQDTCTFITALTLANEAATPQHGYVDIHWSAFGASRPVFQVYRSTAGDAGFAPVSGEIDGAGETDLSFRDESVRPASTYYYKVAYREASEWSYGGVIRVVTPAAVFAIRGIVPNPTTGQTRIDYEIDRSGPVMLAVYNTSGRLVRTLVRGSAQAGTAQAQWDGRSQNGDVLPSGTYFVRLDAGGRILNRKLLLVR